MDRTSFALLAGSLLLSGCIVPNVAPDIVPEDAPSMGGYGNQRWTVAIEDQDGHPIAKAAVVAYWVGFVNATTPNGRLWQAHTPMFSDEGELHYITLRTDETGHASFHAPSHYRVTVAASAPGLTEEYERGVPENGTDIVITLYPQVVHASWDGTWEVLGCNLRTLDYPAHDAAYKVRLHDITFHLNWTNGVPDGVSDWELGYVLRSPLAFDIFGPPCPEPKGAAGAHLSSGPQTETLTLDRQATGADVMLLPPILYFGPVPRLISTVETGVATPSQPYRIEAVAHLGLTPQERAQATTEFPGWQARIAPPDGGDDPAGLYGEPTFETDRSRPNVIPTAAIALVALGLLGVTGFARRRRSP